MTTTPASFVRRQDPFTLVVLHLLGAVAVAIPFISGLVAVTPDTRLIGSATGLVATSLAALLLISNAEKGREAVGRWRFGPWYLIWVTFAFGIASFTWLTPQTGTPSMISQTSVITALDAMTVFTVVWSAGYLIGPPAAVLRSARHLHVLVLGRQSRTLKPGRRPSLVLYGIGFGSRAASLLLQGRLGYLGDASAGVSGASWYNQFLSVGATFATAGLALAAYNHFSGRVERSRRTLVTLGIAEAGFATISGNKEPFVAIALAIMIAYGAARGRIPVKSLALSALGFLIVVLPFNASYRQTINANRDASVFDVMANAPGMFADTLTSGNLSVVDDSYDTLLRRVRLIDGVAITMQKTPSAIPYESPIEYLTAPFIGIVPRLVWPDKPIMIAGYEASHMYYGLPEYVYTSSTLSTPGTLYRHGGWPVFLSAALLLGVFYRLLDKTIRSESRPERLFFTLAFFSVLIKSEIDSVELVIALPALIFGAVMATRLATTKAKAASRPGRTSPRSNPQ